MSAAAPTLQPETPLLQGRRRLAALAVVGAMYFLIGMGLDMILALLPSIAAAFAITSASVILVTTARSTSRFLSPVFGRLSDRFGRKAVLLPALFIFALGNLGSGGAPNFGWLVATQALAGIGLTGLQISLPAYLGDLFHYEVRGRAIGVATIFGAAGTMLGVPAASFLAQIIGVRSAFLALGLMAAVIAVLALFFLASTSGHASSVGSAAPKSEAWYAPLRHAPVRAAMLVTICWLMMSAALYSFLASWLQGTLSFTTAQIGWTFALMGGASVLANTLVASFSDRLGKRRAVLIGLLLGTVTAVPLAVINQPVIALGAIALFILTNEFGFGAYIALLTELLPAQRGMVMSLNLTAWGIGVTIAPLLASLLWGLGGFPAVVALMCAAGLVGLTVAYLFLARPAAPVLQPAQPVP